MIKYMQKTKKRKTQDKTQTLIYTKNKKKEDYFNKRVILNPAYN